MDSTVTGLRPSSAVARAGLSSALASALALLLTTVWLFSLAHAHRDDRPGRRGAPTFEVGEPPVAPSVARSRPVAPPKAAPRGGLEPAPALDLPGDPPASSGRAALHGVSQTPRPARLASACSARGPPTRRTATARDRG